MAACLFIAMLLFRLCFLNSIILMLESVSHASDASREINKEYFLTQLVPNENITSNGTKFSIFCKEAVPKSLVYVWRSEYLAFEKVPRDYKLFEGENEAEVYDKYKSETFFNPASWASWRGSVISLPAFHEYCLGVSTSTKETYTLQLQIRTLNYWKTLQMVLGIVFYFSAPSLSRNSFFHYTAGVSCGVLASVLIVIFVLSKLIPKKSASYTIFAFGFSFVLYLLQQFFHEIPQILSAYMNVVVGYIFLAAFISFLFCYRLGPVKNLRTFRIIQWTMQMVAVMLIFFSTEFQEISTAVIMVILLARIFPTRWVTKIRSKWCWYFPPKVKLLTETEYIEQGNRETKKALEDLRKYCGSPECKTWSTVLKLKSPRRFASFIEGDSHISDEEILLYDSECISDDTHCLLTDDDDDDDDDNNSTNSSFPSTSRQISNHVR